MTPIDDDPQLIVPDAAAWRTWLERNHDQSTGVVLAIAAKGVTEPTTLRLPEAIEEALCFGWVDSQMLRGARGGPYSLLRFTPRRPRSNWSPRNAGLAERLITQGRMHPAGLAAIKLAKSNGRWPDDRCPGANTQGPVG